MNPGRYILPNMGMNFGTYPMMGARYMAPRSIGLFGRIANSIRSFNWSGLLNGANRTLSVVNQTIPLIRQAKPMFNNVKSMIHLARAFGSETSKNMSNNSVTRSSYANIDNKNVTNTVQKKEVVNDNYPNFFI